jgi:membrane protein involved in colicin uptake
MREHLLQVAEYLEELADKLETAAYDETAAAADRERARAADKARQNAEYAAARSAGDAASYRELKKWIGGLASGLGLDPRSDTILKDIWEHVRLLQETVTGD